MEATKEARLLLGKAIREKMFEEVKAECVSVTSHDGLPPKLVALAVGRDGSGEMYLNSQRKACETVGARHEVCLLPETASLNEVRDVIRKLNDNTGVDGIIVQMPLPKHLDPDQVLGVLAWTKDVEGVTPASLGHLLMNRPHLLPCTAGACMELIKASGVDLYGKEVVVVGASVSVGKPISILLLDRMATVTICRSSASKAGTLEDHVRRADVLLAAMGKPQAILGSWIKEGAVVIDIGISYVDGKPVGDVEFEKARLRASAITPVPGGVGPVTTAILMKNLLAAAKFRRAIDQ